MLFEGVEIPTNGRFRDAQLPDQFIKGGKSPDPNNVE
jgi:hypothetical protein